MFDLSRQFRTVHSIKDEDVQQILFYFASLTQPTHFLDFGCHLGHLAVEVALRFEVTVIAVDNFTGTVGDDWMDDTILEMAPTGNFRSLTQANIDMHKDDFKGTIELITPEDFFITNFCFDIVCRNVALYSPPANLYVGKFLPTSQCNNDSSISSSITKASPPRCFFRRSAILNAWNICLANHVPGFIFPIIIGSGVFVP